MDCSTAGGVARYRIGKLPTVPFSSDRQILAPQLPLAGHWSNDNFGRKALSRFRELSGSTPQIADLHYFEIHRTSSQSTVVSRSLLKTTLAHDWLCSSMLGKIWGNLSAKPCRLCQFDLSEVMVAISLTCCCKIKKSISGSAPSQCPNNRRVCRQIVLCN